jgi:hypothetical protein
MKTVSRIIDSEQAKRFALSLVEQCPIDGSMTVTVKKTDKGSTAAQRRLNWMWCGEVAASGLGRDDTKDGVHRTAKWMFARPILLRDDDVYAVLDAAFMDAVKTHQADYRAFEIREFTDRYISTERMTASQRSEYLSEFQRYWTEKGVELTDPQLQGVDLTKWRKS